MRKLIFLFFVILFMTSCKKNVDIDISVEPKIVLKCIIQENDTIKVKVSRSFSSLSNEMYVWNSEFKYYDGVDTNKVYLKNAEVKLYEEGVFLEDLTYWKNGYFIASNPTKVGVQYELRVSADKYESVSAKTRIPSKVDLVEAQLSFVSSTDYDEFYRMKIQYTTPIGNNTLICEAYEKGDYSPDEEDSHYYRIGIGERIEGDQLQSTNKISGGVYWQTSSDQQQIFTKDLYISKAKMWEKSSDTLRYMTLLYNVSDSYLLLKKSIQKYYSSGGDMGNPFVEPVQIYNNVENGLGIFAAKSVDTLKFQFIN